MFSSKMLVNLYKKLIKYYFTKKKVVSVWATCYYVQFIQMNGNNFSQFTFRSFNVNTVQITSLFYVPELGTYERRKLEFEKDMDD